MATYEPSDFNQDIEDSMYQKLDELEKLETIISLMEELEVTSLADARARFETLEASIDEDE